MDFLLAGLFLCFQSGNIYMHYLSGSDDPKTKTKTKKEKEDKNHTFSDNKMVFHSPGMSGAYPWNHWEGSTLRNSSHKIN